MTQKLGRNFKLTIDPKDGQAPIVVTLPFTLRFWMKRDVMASLNNLSVDIYNLSLAKRRRIYQDRYNLRQNIVNGVNLGRCSITLEIGYGNNLYQVYSGDIFYASSTREGTNIVTRIEGLSGAFDIASGQINTTLPAGTTLAQVFKLLIAQLPTISLGAVGNWTDVFTRPVTLSGNAWALIQQYSGNRGYIDNGKAYVLQDNEVVANAAITTFDATTGLLDTPRRESSFVVITTLLEAGVQINQTINISSKVEPLYNGQYKVIGIQHAGVISTAVSGDCRSTFFLLAPNFFTYVPVQSS